MYRKLKHLYKHLKLRGVEMICDSDMMESSCDNILTLDKRCIVEFLLQQIAHNWRNGVYSALVNLCSFSLSLLFSLFLTGWCYNCFPHSSARLITSRDFSHNNFTDFIRKNVTAMKNVIYLYVYQPLHAQTWRVEVSKWSTCLNWVYLK